MHKLCDALDLKNMTLKKLGQCFLNLENQAGTFSRLTFTQFHYNILLTGYENRRACQLEHVIIIQNQVLLSYFQASVYSFVAFPVDRRFLFTIHKAWLSLLSFEAHFVLLLFFQA